eukprot:gi/632968978/ref/XP_007900833.1/ PREDICTED: uncharacterized protein LOC103184563 isoform X1 [Callorhinchus milii]
MNSPHSNHLQQNSTQCTSELDKVYVHNYNNVMEKGFSKNDNLLQKLKKTKESYTILIEQLEDMSMMQNGRYRQVQSSPTKPADVTVPKPTICWSEQASIISNSYRIYSRERLGKSSKQYLMNSIKEKLDSLSNSLPTSARNRRVNSAPNCTSKSTANCYEEKEALDRNFSCPLILDITENYTTPSDSTYDNDPPGTKQPYNAFQKSHLQQLNLVLRPELMETEKRSSSSSLYPENDVSTYPDILPAPFVSMNFSELMENPQWKTFLSIRPNEQLQRLINRLTQMEKMQLNTIEIEKSKVTEAWLSTSAGTCPVNRVKINRKSQNDHLTHITSAHPADCLKKSANHPIQDQNSHHIGSWDLCNYSPEPRVFKSQLGSDWNVDENLNRAICVSNQLTLEEPFAGCASTEAIVLQKPISIYVSPDIMALEEHNSTYANSEALGDSTSSSDHSDVITLEGSTSSCASTEVLVLQECISSCSSTETIALEMPISSHGSTKARALEESTSSYGISKAIALEEPISNYGSSKATSVNVSNLSGDSAEAIALKESLSSNPNTKAIASQKPSLNYESSEGTSFKESILNGDSAEAIASKEPLSHYNNIETIALENTILSYTSTEAKTTHIPAWNFETRKAKTEYRFAWSYWSTDVKTRCRPAWNYGINEAKTEGRPYGSTESQKDHMSARNFGSAESKKEHRPPGNYRSTESQKHRPAWNYGSTESKKDYRSAWNYGSTESKKDYRSAWSYGSTESKKDNRSAWNYASTESKKDHKPALSYGKTEVKTECIPACSNGSTEAKTTGRTAWSGANTQVTTGVKPVKSPASLKSSCCSGKDKKN